MHTYLVIKVLYVYFMPHTLTRYGHRPMFQLEARISIIALATRLQPRLYRRSAVSLLILISTSAMASDARNSG